MSGKSVRQRIDEHYSELERLQGLLENMQKVAQIRARRSKDYLIPKTASLLVEKVKEQIEYHRTQYCELTQKLNGGIQFVPATFTGPYEEENLFAVGDVKLH